MLRLFRHLVAQVVRLFSTVRSRGLRHRPGHFRIRRRTRLLARVPWSRLATANNGAIAVALLTVIIGYYSVDFAPIGANAREIAVSNIGGRPSAPDLPEDSSLVLDGDVAKLLQIAMLQNSLSRLDRVPAYTATFIKEERIDGKLQGEQVMHMKLKHEPHSVLFKVEKGSDPGRVILFPISDEDPRMIVRLGKFGGRLPSVKLEPESPLAMEESRYNIRMAGIKEFTKLALEYRRRDLSLGNKVQTEVRDDVDFDKKPCFSFVTTYANSKAHKEYRKCVLYIDKQLMIPVYARNFTWPELAKEADPSRLDDTTLLEYYAFKDIKLDANLPTNAFALNNPEYPFGGKADGE